MDKVWIIVEISEVITNAEKWKGKKKGDGSAWPWGGNTTETRAFGVTTEEGKTGPERGLEERVLKNS